MINKIAKPTQSDIQTIMSWFSNEEQVRQWGGPTIRYPYTLESLCEDIKLETLASYCLFSPTQQLLAFGQYYLRLGKCHLGRLVVNPSCRGGGIVSELIDHLCHIGAAELDADEYSLFVFQNNEPAIKAYQRNGFSLQDYPANIPMENCWYMTKKN